MPLDVGRLIDSDLYAIATGDEFKAAVTLWAKSWNQVPAGSLPDDDRVLSHLSHTGCDWSHIREVALRGWIKCSDGRLYHPVVCEKALDALGLRVEHKEKVTTQNARKERERAERKMMIHSLRSAGKEVLWNIKTQDLRDRYCDLSQDQRDSRLSENGYFSEFSTMSQKPVTAKSVTGHARVTAKTGTGTGTIEEEDNIQHPTTSPREDKFEKPKPVDPHPTLVAVMTDGGFITPPSDWKTQLRAWKNLGAEFDQDILPTLRKVAQEVEQRGGAVPRMLKFFDSAVREKMAADQGFIEKSRANYLQRRADEDAQIEADMALARDDLEYANNWLGVEPDMPTPRSVAELEKMKIEAMEKIARGEDILKKRRKINEVGLPK
jgi:Protein of unknown function (DUF1376)